MAIPGWHLANEPAFGIAHASRDLKFSEQAEFTPKRGAIPLKKKDGPGHGHKNCYDAHCNKLRFASAMAKYQDIFTSLRSRILAGEFGLDGQLPPERTLAEAYRVSYATLTRSMYELKRAGLVRREWGRGTFATGMHPEAKDPENQPSSHPHEHVKSIERSSSADIAITFDHVYDLTHPFIAELLRGLGERLEETHRTMQLFGLPDQGHGPIETMLREKRLGGVIACSPHRPELIEQIVGSGVSVVSVGSEYPNLQTGSIMPDVEDGARQFADNLATQGHRRVGMVLGPASYSARLIRASALLHKALVRHLRKRAIVCPGFAQIHTDQWMQWRSVEQAVIAMLEHKHRPTAVVCGDAQIAGQISACAHRIGLELPQDLNVLAWCGYEHDTTWPGVQVDIRQAGRLAVDMVCQQMSGQPAEHHILPASTTTNRLNPLGLAQHL